MGTTLREKRGEVGQKLGKVGQEMGDHSVFGDSYSRTLGSLSWFKGPSLKKFKMPHIFIFLGFFIPQDAFKKHGNVKNNIPSCNNFTIKSNLIPIGLTWWSSCLSQLGTLWTLPKCKKKKKNYVVFVKTSKMQTKYYLWLKSVRLILANLIF